MVSLFLRMLIYTYALVSSTICILQIENMVYSNHAIFKR